MLSRLLLKLPLMVVLAFFCALAMMIPAAHASALDDHLSARVFFYFSLVFLFLCAGFALATVNRPPINHPRADLLALVGAFAILPLMMAAPLREAVRDTSFLNAYVEMVSSFTTTGATLFPQADRLPLSVHLWRAMMAWAGGLLIWTAAGAILAPMRLGGFEVVLPRHESTQTRTTGISVRPGERLLRISRTLMPIYAGLTAILWGLLYGAGQSATHAAIHAMSTLSTSGISALTGPVGGAGGRVAELFVMLFLVFALSRQTFATDLHREYAIPLRQDRELRLGLLAVTVVPVLLFARHWLGALEVAEGDDLFAGLRAFWGAAFMVLSFLTTTGFQSMDWGAARAWSGLETPGILFLGFAIFGGGVATTAGGVKLLRVYALYRHGRQEMDLLVHPNAVLGTRSNARRISRTGVQAAWIFFMLFALSIALAGMGFAVLGQDFESALILTIAALSNAGPLTAIAGDAPIALAQLSGLSKGLFCAVMIVGRLETLAIIALLNPDFWR